MTAELQLALAILLPRRQQQPLDLPLLHLLLHPRPPHHRLRQQPALLRLLLPRLRRLRLTDRHDRLPDRVRVRQADIRRHQGRLMDDDRFALFVVLVQHIFSKHLARSIWIFAREQGKRREIRLLRSERFWAWL